MRALCTALTAAGTVTGGVGLALMLGGWIGLMPYPLIASGVLLIAAAVAGLVSGRALDD
jgi:hypothetical protein